MTDKTKKNSRKKLFYNPFLTTTGKSGPERLRLVLYQACLDPYSDLPKPEESVWPVRSLLLFLTNIVNISCNFYLFQYLEDQRKENTGILYYTIKGCDCVSFCQCNPTTNCSDTDLNQCRISRL